MWDEKVVFRLYFLWLTLCWMTRTCTVSYKKIIENSVIIKLFLVTDNIGDLVPPVAVFWYR